MQPKVSILLVEDDPSIRLMLEEVLHEGGYEVAAAQDGHEAMRILEAQHQDLRGVVTDINLGDGPVGWDVARHGRELRPDMAVVYMSGGAAHEWTSQGVPKSIMVTKPFAPAQIVTAVSTLLVGGLTP